MLGVVLAVVAGGVIAAAIFFRESTTPVDVEEAVGDFRDEAGTVETAGTALPEPGVYTYATSGRESIDALDGRHHDYPAETTITVRHEGCGAVLAWRPLAERFDEMVICPETSGTALPRYRTYHEFFGMSDDREFECEPGSLWYPSSTEPGTTWTLRCATEDVEVVRTGTIIGLSEVDVGGSAVEVLTFELAGRDHRRVDRYDRARRQGRAGYRADRRALDGGRRAERQPGRRRPLPGALPPPADVADPTSIARFTTLWSL